MEASLNLLVIVLSLLFGGALVAGFMNANEERAIFYWRNIVGGLMIIASLAVAVISSYVRFGDIVVPMPQSLVILFPLTAGVGFVAIGIVGLVLRHRDAQKVGSEGRV